MRHSLRGRCPCSPERAALSTKKKRRSADALRRNTLQEIVETTLSTPATENLREERIHLHSIDRRRLPTTYKLLFAHATWQVPGAHLPMIFPNSTHSLPSKRPS